MDKKYLATLEWQPCALPKKRGKHAYKKIVQARTVTTRQGDVLEVALYNPDRTPRCRIYIDKRTWHTQTPDGCWHKDTLGYAVNAYCTYVSQYDVDITAGSGQAVLGYLQPKHEDDPIRAIQEHMDQIKRESACCAEQRKEQRMLAYFARLPELPDGIDGWIRSGPLRNSRYLFIAPVGGRRGTTRPAYCTHCERDVELPRAAHHGQMYSCPMCGSHAACKSMGVSRTRLCDTAAFSVLQRAGDDVFIRQCRAVRDYRGDPRRVTTVIRDEYRYVVGRKTYQWKSDGRDTWEQTSRVYNALSGPCYCPDYDALFAGLPAARHGIREYAEHISPYYISYMAALPKHPYLEYMVKAGLYRLAGEIVTRSGYGNDDMRDYGFCDRARSLPELLDVSRQDLQFLRQTDTGLYMLPVFRELRRRTEKVSAADWRFVCGQKYMGNCLWEILQYCSLHRCANYLRRQYALAEGTGIYDGYYAVLRDWYDYTVEAEKLGYDLHDDAILRPRSLADMHARISRLIEERANADLNERLRIIGARLQLDYGYAEDGLMIVAPACTEDFAAEGRVLGHCVGGYASRVAEGATAILFIRRTSAPETPYYTLELQDGQVIQCRTKHNKSYTQDPPVKAFVGRWLHKIVQPAEKRTKNQKEAQRLRIA